MEISLIKTMPIELLISLFEQTKGFADKINIWNELLEKRDSLDNNCLFSIMNSEDRDIYDATFIRYLKTTDFKDIVNDSKCFKTQFESHIESIRVRNVLDKSWIVERDREFSKMTDMDSILPILKLLIEKTGICNGNDLFELKKYYSITDLGIFLTIVNENLFDCIPYIVKNYRKPIPYMDDLDRLSVDGLIWGLSDNYRNKLKDPELLLRSYELRPEKDVNLTPLILEVIKRIQNKATILKYFDTKWLSKVVSHLKDKNKTDILPYLGLDTESVTFKKLQSYKGNIRTCLKKQIDVLLPGNTEPFIYFDKHAYQYELDTNFVKPSCFSVLKYFTEKDSDHSQLKDVRLLFTGSTMDYLLKLPKEESERIIRGIEPLIYNDCLKKSAEVIFSSRILDTIKLFPKDIFSRLFSANTIFILSEFQIDTRLPTQVVEYNAYVFCKIMENIDCSDWDLNLTKNILANCKSFLTKEKQIDIDIIKDVISRNAKKYRTEQELLNSIGLGIKLVGRFNKNTKYLVIANKRVCVPIDCYISFLIVKEFINTYEQKL